MKKIILRLTTIFFCLFYAHQSIALTSYHIGNSLTWDAINAGGLVDVFAKGGINLEESHHIKCGSTLVSILNNPDITCVTPNSGPWNTALVNNAYDFLILQPHEGGISTETEIAAMQSFASMVDSNIVIYEAYPEFDNAANISEYYLLPDQTRFRHTKAEFNAIRDSFPKAIIVRAMEVIIEIDARARKGEIPGIATAQDLYRDSRHMNNMGKYALALTFYSSITNLDPTLTGITLHDRFTGVSKEQAIAIQNTVKSIIIGVDEGSGILLSELYLLFVLILIFRLLGNRSYGK